MADVTYSATTLAQLGQEMTALASSVLDESEMSGLDDTHLARPEIVSALQEFESDWATQRQTLSTRLEASGQLASGAGTGFTEADQKLAEDALTEAGP